MASSWAFPEALDPSKTVISLRLFNVFDTGPSTLQLHYFSLCCAIVGSSWALLGPSWGPLGAILGPSWAILGPTWALPKRPGDDLGGSWGHLGQPSGSLGALMGHLGAFLANFRSSWANLVPRGGSLEAFWKPSWPMLGTCFGHLGAILGPPLARLG